MTENNDIFEMLNGGTKEGDPDAKEILSELQFAVKEITAVSKHMHIVVNSEGMILWLRSLSFILDSVEDDIHAEEKNKLLFSKKISPGDQVPERMMRSLLLAKEKLSLALTVPDNVKTILALGKVEYLLGVYGLSQGNLEPEAATVFLEYLDGIYTLFLPLKRGSLPFSFRFHKTFHASQRIPPK